ncbi:hypothetical protein GCM10010439_17480 [Actinocorallia aurantiaca]|uniref:Alcohol dehydrogenase-like N-terminal domain-containing protein n=1 Tax=Actinocorallia aurantiaca TaxID=46204 RepID=A0ABN3U2J5_9ACTN
MLRESTDAIVRVPRAAICGGDPHPYHSMPATDRGRPVGHELIGTVEDVGSDVHGVKRGPDGVAVPVGGRHLRLLPPRAAVLLPARRPVQVRRQGAHPTLTSRRRSSPSPVCEAQRKGGRQ